MMNVRRGTFLMIIIALFCPRKLDYPRVPPDVQSVQVSHQRPPGCPRNLNPSKPNPKSSLINMPLNTDPCHLCFRFSRDAFAAIPHRHFGESLRRIPSPPRPSSPHPTTPPAPSDPILTYGPAVSAVLIKSLISCGVASTVDASGNTLNPGYESQPRVIRDCLNTKSQLFVPTTQ